jgi:hypothetical protein
MAMLFIIPHEKAKQNTKFELFLLIFFVVMQTFWILDSQNKNKNHTSNDVLTTGRVIFAPFSTFAV